MFRQAMGGRSGEPKPYKLDEMQPVSLEGGGQKAVDEIFAGGKVRAHPTAQGLAAAIRDRGLPREPLEALVDARLRDLDGWPLGEEEVIPYIDATAGRLMALAATALDPVADADAVRLSARAWGLAGLMRRRSFHGICTWLMVIRKY